MILVTLACVYFGLWEATRRKGVEDVNECFEWRHEYSGSDGISYPVFFPGGWWNVSATAPLIVSIDVHPYPTRRHYYFWFFGYVAKLPYERDVL